MSGRQRAPSPPEGSDLTPSSNARSPDRGRQRDRNDRNNRRGRGRGKSVPSRGNSNYSSRGRGASQPPRHPHKNIDRDKLKPGIELGPRPTGNDNANKRFGPVQPYRPSQNYDNRHTVTGEKQYDDEDDDDDPQKSPKRKSSKKVPSYKNYQSTNRAPSPTPPRHYPTHRDRQIQEQQDKNPSEEVDNKCPRKRPHQRVNVVDLPSFNTWGGAQYLEVIDWMEKIRIVDWVRNSDSGRMFLAGESCQECFVDHMLRNMKPRKELDRGILRVLLGSVFRCFKSNPSNKWNAQYTLKRLGIHDGTLRTLRQAQAEHQHALDEHERLLPIGVLRPVFNFAEHRRAEEQHDDNGPQDHHPRRPENQGDKDAKGETLECIETDSRTVANALDSGRHLKPHQRKAGNIVPARSHTHQPSSTVLTTTKGGFVRPNGLSSRFSNNRQNGSSSAGPLYPKAEQTSTPTSTKPKFRTRRIGNDEISEAINELNARINKLSPNPPPSDKDKVKDRAETEKFDTVNASAKVEQQDGTILLEDLDSENGSIAPATGGGGNDVRVPDNQERALIRPKRDSDAKYPFDLQEVLDGALKNLGPNSPESKKSQASTGSPSSRVPADANTTGAVFEVADGFGPTTDDDESGGEKFEDSGRVDMETSANTVGVSQSRIQTTHPESQEQSLIITTQQITNAVASMSDNQSKGSSTDKVGGGVQLITANHLQGVSAVQDMTGTASIVDNLEQQNGVTVADRTIQQPADTVTMSGSDGIPTPVPGSASPAIMAPDSTGTASIAGSGFQQPMDAEPLQSVGLEANPTGNMSSLGITLHHTGPSGSSTVQTATQVITVTASIVGRSALSQRGGDTSRMSIEPVEVASSITQSQELNTGIADPSTPAGSLEPKVSVTIAGKVENDAMSQTSGSSSPKIKLLGEVSAADILGWPLNLEHCNFDGENLSAEGPNIDTGIVADDESLNGATVESTMDVRGANGYTSVSSDSGDGCIGTGATAISPGDNAIERGISDTGRFDDASDRDAHVNDASVAAKITRDCGSNVKNPSAQADLSTAQGVSTASPSLYSDSNAVRLPVVPCPEENAHDSLKTPRRVEASTVSADTDSMPKQSHSSTIDSSTAAIEHNLEPSNEPSNSTAPKPDSKTGASTSGVSKPDQAKSDDMKRQSSTVSKTVGTQSMANQDPSEYSDSEIEESRKAFQAKQSASGANQGGPNKEAKSESGSGDNLKAYASRESGDSQANATSVAHPLIPTRSNMSLPQVDSNGPDNNLDVFVQTAVGLIVHSFIPQMQSGGITGAGPLRNAAEGSQEYRAFDPLEQRLFRILIDDLSAFTNAAASSIKTGNRIQQVDFSAWYPFLNSALQAIVSGYNRASSSANREAHLQFINHNQLIRHSGNVSRSVLSSSGSQRKWTKEDLLKKYFGTTNYTCHSPSGSLATPTATGTFVSNSYLQKVSHGHRASNARFEYEEMDKEKRLRYDDYDT